MKRWNIHNYKIVDYPDWVWILVIMSTSIGCSTYCDEGYWSLLVCMAVVWCLVLLFSLSVVLFDSLCTRKSVTHVMYWSIKTTKRGLLLAEALFCMLWSLALVPLEWEVRKYLITDLLCSPPAPQSPLHNVVEDVPFHLGQCFSTAGPRPGTGPWHQLYRVARGKFYNE
jgi:hypothetical protein